MSEEEYTERLSVVEAAEVLGVTRDAIHKRIRRGTIRHEKGEDGRFYVYVDTSTRWLDMSADESKDESKVETLERLIDTQHERIVFLERELERRGDESESLHRIVAGLTQLNSQLSSRLPELEAGASPEAPRATEPSAAAEGPEGAAPQSDGEGEGAPGGAREETILGAARDHGGGAAGTRRSGRLGGYIRVVLLIGLIALLWITSLVVGLNMLNA